MFSHLYQNNSPNWEVHPSPPFDECIVSWNGSRPQIGKWVFWISLHQDGLWSSWLRYAEWGACSQRTFHSESINATTYQDAACPRSGYATGFRIKVEAEEGADLTKLNRLTACISRLSECTIPPFSPHSPIQISNAPGLSQIALGHPLSQRICSPTSIVNATALLTTHRWDPIDFAKQVYDDGFDIYGNWILNVAAAPCPCYVERLHSFEKIDDQLKRKLPVIVSIRGPLTGTPQPYSTGHLLCVVGYKQEKVICIDSGFPTDLQTLAEYPLPEFLIAWNRRKNLSYIFG